MRTIGFTLVGQAVDSLLFLTLAFAGTIPTAALLRAFLTKWLAKSLYEAAMTPATYAIVAFLKREEGVNVYDHKVRFTPLSLRG